MRTGIAVAVVLMLVVAGCSQAPGAGTSTAGTNTTAPTTGETPGEKPVVKPDNPETDVLGWEGGIWYNETIAVNPNDGLNETELNKTVKRSMARVERVRGLEFESQVPVEIMTREEFRKSQNDRSTPPKRKLFDNVKFEALMMINESTDSIAVQNSNSGSSVGGFYSPSEKRIVVISENASTPQLDEITLSQELFHALQDQKFNLSKFNQSTRELHNAKDGVIEGDGNLVDYLYEKRCKNQWSGDCLTPESSSGGGGGLANIGPYLLKFQPYSDGPPFVRGVQRRGGWEAVNELYQNPPASTEQVIHPQKYPDDTPTEFTVGDKTSGDWERLRPKGRPSFASVGEAGIFSMFMYPAYESGGQTQIVSASEFINRNASTGDMAEFDPLNYNSSYSDGWDGDRLVVYTSESAAKNETGYVWQSKWDSKQDANEFVEGYTKLLQYRDAEKVDGRANTWVVEGNGFADAFYVTQQGNTVTIVNAPTVEDLSKVRQGAAPKQ
ncbi:Hvo_1808 family surface protein [Halorussus halophilus]|uniref:Hvo_1808 family surface protein n=1 Tax=Halorussus halophilus TaxID=2650975 RepID=UPI0013019BED|nr:Hvo_1808 family surface protein [Halorussus halophilus]